MADDAQTFGPNDWLVEEMYDRYRSDPNSVSKNWQEFFSDNFRPQGKERESLRESTGAATAVAPR